MNHDRLFAIECNERSNILHSAMRTVEMLTFHVFVFTDNSIINSRIYGRSVCRMGNSDQAALRHKHNFAHEIYSVIHIHDEITAL